MLQIPKMTTRWIDLGPVAKDAVPAVIKALEDEDPKVRGKVATALGVIGRDDDDVVRALINVLEDEDVLNAPCRFMRK